MTPRQRRRRNAAQEVGPQSPQYENNIADENVPPHERHDRLETVPLPLNEQHGTVPAAPLNEQNENVPVPLNDQNENVPLAFRYNRNTFRDTFSIGQLRVHCLHCRPTASNLTSFSFSAFISFSFYHDDVFLLSVHYNN